MSWRDVVDGGLEASVVGSYSRLGPAVRRRLWGWEPLEAHRLDGRVAVVTGATSGLGRAAAERLGALGASLVLVVRDLERGSRAAAEIERATGSIVAVVRADMGDLESVRDAAREVTRVPSIDILIHNAGGLGAERRVTGQGIEQTMATHVVGPFLLTHLCMPRLVAAAPSRVIVVTSGGMYTQGLDEREPLTVPSPYEGAATYARAKRAQVSLVEACAERMRRQGIHLMAMHPGWADTPGVKKSLPRFRRVMRPLLRSADEGADTMVWLASAPLRDIGSGTLWLDRRRRGLHRLPATARSDTAAARRRLLEECRRLAGVTDPAP